MNHAVEIGDTQIRISDHRKLYLGALRLLDVVLPCNVVIDRVDRQPDHLDAALFKFALELRGGAKLSGADRGIVLGMREQHAPGVCEPRVQVDFPNGGMGPPQIKLKGKSFASQRRERRPRTVYTTATCG
jgi:hypothetical protein